MNDPVPPLTLQTSLALAHQDINYLREELDHNSKTMDDLKTKIEVLTEKISVSIEKINDNLSKEYVSKNDFDSFKGSLNGKFTAFAITLTTLIIGFMVTYVLNSFFHK